jgi:hypothetical protein
MYGEDYGENRVTYLLNAFEEGRLLFYNEMLNRTSMLREMDADFGIVPMPKADEKQENYASFIHQTNSSVVCVPVTVRDIGFVGSMLEDMAYYSHYNLYPTYIDTTIKGKYLRDSESAEMVNIILNSIRFDFALTTGSAAVAKLRTMLNEGDIHIASGFAAGKDAYEAALRTSIAPLID